ncbi:MAG: helical backbone metal receptor [Bacteroidota bacterium]
MPIYNDQMGREIVVPHQVKRIISLVPSQTELLIDLGLSEQLVGITKFCVHPSEVTGKIPKIGGTKTYHLDKIEAAAPDLIIGNKEENFKDGIEQLAQKYPVWMSDIFTLEDAIHMIEQLGLILGKTPESSDLIQEIQLPFQQLTFCQEKVLSLRKKVAYLIWQKPMMAVGGNTFIQDMIDRLGLENVFKARERYPELNERELSRAQPNYIFLSSEPFPFREKHQEYFKQACPGAQVILVDGEMFSWYGSRLVKSGKYLQALQENILKNQL